VKDSVRSGHCGDRDSGVEYQRHRAPAGRDTAGSDVQDHLFPRPHVGRRHDLSLRGATRERGLPGNQELQVRRRGGGCYRGGAGVHDGRLVTGSIWGREIWGIWWTWDARLTSALVCWLLYAGYLMLRKAIEEPTERATFAAVFSIFAFMDVPIVVFSIKWWRTQHPAPVFWAGGSFPPDWTKHLLWNMAAMMLLGIVMVAVRLRQEEAQREIDSLRRVAHAQ